MILQEFFTEIPTYDNGDWTVTTFSTHDQFRDFVDSLFKEPGQYEFDDTSLLFNQQSRSFRENGYYCISPELSKDFTTYWLNEKDKCRKGVIFKNGGKTWYLTRYYYFWINFLKIYDKVAAKFDFPTVWDTQYHVSLYSVRSTLHHLHSAVTKKRQVAMSYYFAAELINEYWFEEGAVLKIGASDKKYINEVDGTWKYLNEYNNFLNANTAWYRPSNPGKVFNWQQKEVEFTPDGREVEYGNKSTIAGITFEKSPMKGIGGPTKKMFYEEGGEAPTANITFQFIKPAMKMGEYSTGTFAIAGSVGQLDKCEPLKRFTFHPHVHGFLAVKTNLINAEGLTGETALFIPEQWSMLPYIDQYGNSLVREALEALNKRFEELKKTASAEDYQLEISQHPRNLEEAYAFRKEAIYPLHLINHQLRRIQEKEYPCEYIDLSRDATGKIVSNHSMKIPISEFPIASNKVDKEGVIIIWERPPKDPEWGAYYATIDPVGEGRAEHVDNRIFTPTGRKRIGDVKPGDKIIGSDGLSYNVRAVYPQGKKDLLRVSFNDGSSILVCEDHLWSVELNGGTRGNIVLSTKQLIDKDYVIRMKGFGRNKDKTYKFKSYYKRPDGSSRWKIPIVKPVKFNNRRKLKIDPYLLGLILGDGGITGRSVRFTSADEEIIGSIKTVLDTTLTITKVPKTKYDYRIVTSKHRNHLTAELRRLQLQGKGSHTKFIPDYYKYTSFSNRLALLQGLMDTDGYSGNHGAEYYTVSERLGKDVVELVQSMGGIAKIRRKTTNRKLRNGCGYVYVLRIILPDDYNPFRLQRKASLYKPRVKYKGSRYIENIVFVGNDDAVCLSVDSPDNLYVTEHAIVTHNTTTSDSLCSIYIQKNSVQVTKISSGEPTTYIERDKIVASWCGRFDDITKTHERLEIMIEWYNAWTLIENNVTLFIMHMMNKKKQHYLIPKDQMVFLKEHQANQSVYQAYGWKNTGNLFPQHLTSYAIEYLKEELHHDLKPDGTIVRTTYGVERIPDPMLLREMAAYQPKLNVDRLVSFAALAAFSKVQEANRGLRKRVENTDLDLSKSKKSSILSNKSMFHNIGSTYTPSSKRPLRNPFHNIR